MKEFNPKGKMLKLSTLLLASTLVFSACSGNNGNNGNVAAPNGNTNSSTETPVESNNGPMTKYDPPIEVSMVRNLSDVVENNVLSVLDGETFEDNRWSRVYEDQLGIKITYDWVIKGNPDSDQYKQKLNVTLASGELPDVTPVDAVNLMQFADADLAEDMTENYDQFAAPLL